MIENHPILFCAVLAIIENFAIESMSRRSVLKCLKYIAKSPHVFIYNALIILLTLSICLLFRRRVFGIVLLSAPWLICGLINNVVLSYRVTPLGAIDFQIVKMSLILVYLTKTQRILLYCSVGLLAVAIVVLWIVGPKISGKLSYGKNVASIAGLVICVLIATNLGLNFKALSSDFGNIVGAYNDYGFVYCFSSSVIDTGIDKPSGYSGTTVSEELDRLPAEKDAPALVIVEGADALAPALEAADRRTLVVVVSASGTAFYGLAVNPKAGIVGRAVNAQDIAVTIATIADLPVDEDCTGAIIYQVMKKIHHFK